MELKSIIAVRSNGVEELLKQNTYPEDVVFYVNNGEMGIALIPFKEDFPPSFKYEARKQALQKILDGSLSEIISQSEEVFYCSFDTIFNVDYVFNCKGISDEIKLYIVRDGKIIRRYLNYQLDYDERIDLANI